MAILRMERIRVCAMKRDRKKLLELIQRRENVEVFDAGGPDDIFDKMDTATSRSLFLKNAETAEKAVLVLNKFTPDNLPSLGFLRGRTGVNLAVSDQFYKMRDDVLRVCQRIMQLERDIAEANSEILRGQAQQLALEPWLNLPVPQTFSGTRKTAFFIGSLEGEHNLESILASLVSARPELDPVHVEIISASKVQTNLFVVVPKRLAAMAEDALRAIGFARPASASHHMPQKKMALLQEQIDNAKKEIEKATKEIISHADRRDDIRFLMDHMTMRAEKYEALELLAQSRHTFVLDGFVPAIEVDGLLQELSTTFECSAEMLPHEEVQDEPVKLKNSWFSEPVESVVESYSLPGKGEVDPTSVMSIFYYIMFGLMFSDAGYGLIMAGVCGFCLLKFKNMEPNWSKNLRLFFWCGISTIFWGIIFSSYFGDIADVIATNYFGATADMLPIIPPVWFLPMQYPMLLLMFSLGIGTIHLTTGYLMKAYTHIKNKEYSGVIYDTVFPIIAWYPLIVLLMGSDMFEEMVFFKLNLPPNATTICFAFVLVGVVGIILFSGRESKGGIRILKGIYGVYNTLSGWLSDTLSYSRLLALGLATGVIASVMNQMGAMVGSGVIGTIVFIVVFCVGQSLNFGINVLGAYVHSNRLAYVEFFGKFYDGGGRKFAPLGIHTKHYKIIEEESSK